MAKWVKEWSVCLSERYLSSKFHGFDVKSASACGNHACTLDVFTTWCEPKRLFFCFWWQRRQRVVRFLLIMPPSKVCPQCDAVVPIRVKVRKSCLHVFRTNRQTEHTLPGRAVKQLWVALSDSVKSVIKATDKLQKACKRAVGSSKPTLHRQQHNKASVRAAESSEQAFHRQQYNREYKSTMRAAKDMSVEQVIIFIARMGRIMFAHVATTWMYKKCVIPCDPAKYSKCGD